MSSGKKRQLSGDSERVSNQDGSAHDTTTKAAGDKTLKAAKRSKRVTLSTEAGDTTSDKQESKGAVVKVKRQAWTAIAISTFFEGLCEHGKDFGRILRFMKNKYRKKQDPFISNLMRNQVRFFYYRTWHKVSTLLNMSGKQTRQAAPPTSILVNDVELKKELGEEAVVEMLSSPLASTLTASGRDEAEMKKDLEEEVVEMLGSPLPSQEEPGVQGQQQNLSEEETEGEGEGDIAFDISLDEGEDPSVGERNLFGNDEEVVSENSNGARNPATDYCESPCQKEQSSAHFGLGPTPTTNAISTISTTSTICTTSTTDSATVTAVTTIATAASISVAVTTNTSIGGKADSVGMSEGGTVGGKGKERHQEGQQGRDSGSMVRVHGTMHSLDLVALICYSKIKKKFTGDKQTLAKKLHELIYTGTTTIRVKGKRKIQLKIPHCPALRGSKALNPASVSSTTAEPQITSSVSDSEVAGAFDQKKSLVVELFPRNSHSWAYVQKLAMNPRIRLTVPTSKKVSDVVHVVASRWKLINHDELASDVLKLYCQSLVPCPHMDVAKPGSTIVSSTGGMRTECQTNHESDFTIADQEPACQDGPDTLEINNLMAECTNSSSLACDPLPASPVLDGPQPLEPSSLTIGELYEQQSNKDKISLKLGLLYEIRQNQDCSEENRLRLLLQLAEFVAKNHTKFLSAGFATPSPCTPIAPDTPTTHSSPLVLSSPAVTEYMRSLPKKSPLKSPLSKYRRMKSRLRQSPLKTPSPLARPKPVRLQFNSQPPSTHHSSVQDADMTDAPSIAPNMSSPLTSCASAVPLNVDTLSSAPPAVRVLHPLLNAGPQSEVFSLAKHNADRKKSKPKKEQKVHLVTVSKKALKNSGSFSRLRLNDLFTTVSENLKDVVASEDGGKATGEVMPEDPLVPSMPPAMDSSPSVPPQDSSSPLLMLQKQQREARAPLHVVTQVAGHSGSPQASSTIAQSTCTSSSGRVTHRPSTVTVTVLPSISTIGMSPPVVVSSSATPAAMPSPLEKLASTVATSGSLAQWAPPTSSASLTPSHRDHHIAVRPLTIGSPLPNVVSAYQHPAPSLSAIKALTILSRRQTKPRTAKNMPPPTQRPVVPKPLLYLPQMAQMKSSLGLNPDSGASSSGQHSVTGSSEELGSIATSSNVLKSTRAGPSGVAPPGNIDNQTVQSQLISLLQSMLQQQLSRQHQGKAQSRPIPPSSEMKPPPPPPVPVQSASQPIFTSAVIGAARGPASNPPLPLLTSSPTQLATLSAPGLSSNASYHSPSLPLPHLPPEHAVVQSSSDTVNELLRGLATSSPSQDHALRKLSEETSDVLPTFAKAMMQLEAIGSSTSSQHHLQRGSAAEVDGPGDLGGVPEINPPLTTSSAGQRDSSGSSDSLLAFLQGDSCEMGSLSDSNLQQLMEQVDFSDAFSQLKDILKTPERPKESVYVRSTSRDAGMTENLSHNPPLLDHDNSICSLLDLLSSPLKGRNNVESQHTSSREISVASLPDATGIIHEGTDVAGIRHMLEENSVDYINKFRELASAMNRSCSS